MRIGQQIGFSQVSFEYLSTSTLQNRISEQIGPQQSSKSGSQQSMAHMMRIHVDIPLLDSFHVRNNGRRSVTTALRGMALPLIFSNGREFSWVITGLFNECRTLMGNNSLPGEGVLAAEQLVVVVPWCSVGTCDTCPTKGVSLPEFPKSGRALVWQADVRRCNSGKQMWSVARINYVNARRIRMLVRPCHSSVERDSTVKPLCWLVC